MPKRRNRQRQSSVRGWAYGIHNLHNTIMQSVLGGSLHKINTSYLLLGLYHASLNKISIVLMQITPQDERYYEICASSEFRNFLIG